MPVTEKRLGDPARLVTRGLPEGYDTVIGHLLKVDPEAVEILLSDPIDAILGDQSKADEICNRRNITVLLTVPPMALYGVMEHIKVYPIAVLREVIGE